MQIWIGTSGYAYKEWTGPFYPPKTKSAEMLGYYAERLDTVEINNTFYRMPRERLVLDWADRVPAAFRFVLKASRRITHFGRLRNVEDELRYFLQTSQALGEKRGPTLFQLPPNLKKDLPLLADFLAILPPRWTAAFEFRHVSWFDDGVYDALRERNAALVLAETDDATVPLVQTGTWGYLRLRQESYTDEEIGAWATTLAERQWDEAYVFFKHEDKGLGPAYALRLREALAS